MFFRVSKDTLHEIWCGKTGLLPKRRVGCSKVLISGADSQLDLVCQVFASAWFFPGNIWRGCWEHYQAVSSCGILLHLLLLVTTAK